MGDAKRRNAEGIIERIVCSKSRVKSKARHEGSTLGPNLLSAHPGQDADDISTSRYSDGILKSKFEQLIQGGMRYVSTIEMSL